MATKLFDLRRQRRALACLLDDTTFVDSAEGFAFWSSWNELSLPRSTQKRPQTEKCSAEKMDAGFYS